MNQKLYYYGIWLTKTKKNCIFVCTKKDKIPTSAIHVSQGFMPTKRAYELANQVKKDYNNIDFNHSDIVLYIDEFGHHTALVLRKEPKKSHFLFVTSNPSWNDMSRQITLEEEALLGYPNKGHISYFAPVKRPNKYVVVTGKSYPMYRIKDLIVEFGI